MRAFYLAYMAGLLTKWMAAQDRQRLFCLRSGHKHTFVSDVKRAKTEGRANAWVSAFRHGVSLISKSCSADLANFIRVLAGPPRVVGMGDDIIVDIGFRRIGQSDFFMAFCSWCQAARSKREEPQSPSEAFKTICKYALLICKLLTPGLKVF